MKAAVISLGSVSSKWIVKAMSKYFDSVDNIDIRDIEINISAEKLNVLYKGKQLGDYDCIYAKGSFRYQPILRAITTALYDNAYMPIKAPAFTVGHDKVLTQLDIQKNNIPMPKTYLSSSAQAAKKILEKMNYPLVMKFPSGTQGKGVMFADSYSSASSMLDALSALRQPFLIQEYVETGGVDTRAIVIGDKVVASMKRESTQGEKRANIHAGGSGKACELDEYTKKIAIETAHIIGADICAVDILESAKGPVVIEVNLSPGLQGIMKATKIDVADKIAKYFYKKAEERTESTKKIGTTKLMEELGIHKEDKLKEILTNLDFRGNRILLPEAVTNITKFNDKDEYSLISEEDYLIIKKFAVNSKKK